MKIKRLFLVLLPLFVGSSYADEVQRDPLAPEFLPDAPLTSVVVTQCNEIVVVYMTTKDGKLVRFDKSSGIPSDKLISAAYSAKVSERVEVSCNSQGIEGLEKHEEVL